MVSTVWWSLGRSNSISNTTWKLAGNAKSLYPLLLNPKGVGDSWGVWQGHAHTAVLKIDNQQGPNI